MKTPQPPKWARKFLHWFCRGDLADAVLGDLEELYHRSFQTNGKRHADWHFVLGVILFLKPFAFERKSKSTNSNHLIMFKHDFKVAWRNLSKQKLYSSIKIGGFAIGIASCLLITLFIFNELSYDRHFSKDSQVYRVIREASFDGQTSNGAHFPHPFAATLEEEYPEIQMAGRFRFFRFSGAGSEVRRLDKPQSQHEKSLAFVDHTLLQILEAPFIKGNPTNALQEPNSIVITKSKADKYFPDDDPIGQILLLNNDESTPYKITGVIADFPVKSHFRYDFLISLADREFYSGEGVNWRNDNYCTYLLLRPGTDVAAFEQKLSGMIEKYFLPPRLQAGREDDIAWVKSFKTKLQPLSDVYLNIDEVGDGLHHGDIRYIWSFGAINAFILLIACINFINLSTARSADRAKEVGLRKVVGSHRVLLIRQFLLESTLFSFFAFVLGVGIAWLALPYFSQLLGKALIFPWQESWFVLTLLTGTVIIGIIAGLYPAAYLSSFKPVKVLKGEISRGSRNSSIRSGLVILQFAISVVLIIGILIVNKQMNFILDKKLGFDKDRVLVLEGTHTLGNSIQAFKNELLSLSEISSATVSEYLPIEGTRRNNGGWAPEGVQLADGVSGQHWAVDPDYAQTMGMRIVKGRDFSSGIAADSSAVLINESLANSLNFENPVGQTIYNWLGAWTIVGVVEDFHFELMTKEIRPLGMILRPSNRMVSIKINSNNMPETVKAITGIWNTFSPHQPMRYTFLDVSYARMYDDVKRTSNILTVFTILAVLIACLGLFALSSFMSEQRGKEISIRKVLGASLGNIFRLLTLDFLKLVFLALVVGIPIGWFLMNRWLEDFAYRIDTTLEVFAIAGSIALLIALLTVSSESIKAGLINPVKRLKE